MLAYHVAMSSSGSVAPPEPGVLATDASRSPTRTHGPVRRLLSESGLYGLSSAAVQGVNVVLIPVYARVLGLAGVGEIALLNTTSLLLFTIAGFALAQAFFRSYVRDARDRSARRRVLGVSTVLRSIVAGITVGIYLLIIYPTLAQQLIDVPADRLAIALIGPIVLFDAIGQGPLQWLRGERRPRPFVMLSLGRAILAAVGSLFAVIVGGWGIVGVASANLVAAALAAAVGIAMMWRAQGQIVAWDSKLAGSMLRFSAPLVPAAVALWALNLSDRFLLKGFVDVTAVGIYVVGYTLGAVVNFAIVQPFSLAWAAAKWDVARAPDAAEQLRRFQRLVGAICAGGALVVSALGVDILLILVPSAAEEARYIVPFSAFAYAIYASYNIVSTSLTIRDRTVILGAVTIVAGVANVVINLLLIPRFGIIGAGIATLLTYAGLTFGTWLVSPRGDPMTSSFPETWAPIAVALPLAFLAILGPDYLIWRLLCIAVYGVVVLAVGWLTPELLSLLRLARSRTAT